MKRIIVAIILAAGLGGAGYQYMLMSSTDSIITKLQGQITETNSQISDYQQQLSSLPISQYATNSDLVSAFFDTKVLSLISITAQDRDEQGEYSNIVTVKTVDDVAYFTNTISRIVITASYKDFAKAYKYVSELSVPYSSVSFDVDKKTVSIFVTPVTIGTSDISNEVTAPLSEDTETSVESLDAIDNQEATTEFDIQYLGGDKDE